MLQPTSGCGTAIPQRIDLGLRLLSWNGLMQQINPRSVGTVHFILLPEHRINKTKSRLQAVLRIAVVDKAFADLTNDGDDFGDLGND